MQDIGVKEVKRLREASDRKMQSDGPMGLNKKFALYSKRLVKDLEGKGIVRTAVESLRLSKFADDQDVLMAECVRTFATVTFRAADLLKREEIETGKASGKSIIVAVYHAKGEGRKTFTDAPMDLLYGFRGAKRKVDLLSPFEMLRYWHLERVLPPSNNGKKQSAIWTDEGLDYKQRCKENKEKPFWLPGVHYQVIDAHDRILMPELPALSNLRHRWFWQRRQRPYVPVFSYAKIPSKKLSPEENARLLSIYMRPWTLQPEDATERTPLLSRLGVVKLTLDDAQVDQPVAPGASHRTVHRRIRGKTPAVSTSFAAHRSTLSAAIDQAGIVNSEDTSNAQDLTSQTSSNPTSHRVQRKSCRTQQLEVPQSLSVNMDTEVRSYVRAWQQYLDKGVVSETSRLFITNMLMATAARVVEDPGDSSEDSDDFEYDHNSKPAGSLDLIHKTLGGLVAQCEDEGAEGLGRHARTIRLGRSMWQSAPLSEHELARAQEVFFDDGSFPSSADAKAAAAEALKEQIERVAPFVEGTEPYSSYTVINYGKLIDEWFAKLSKEELQPNPQQMAVLQDVKIRILLEKEMQNEGPWIQRSNKRKKIEDPREEPRRGLIHGVPGTGKSEVIKWLCRLFTEGLGWEHGDQFLCLAFQNRVAFKMGGVTIHTGGGIPVGAQQQERKLEHLDVDHLFRRNQLLRWLLFDEIFMNPDELMGQLNYNFQNAAPEASRFKRRVDGSVRAFGGCNYEMFGDMQQLPPIPASTALFNPPVGRKSALAREVLDMFWSNGPDALNYFQELIIQVRIADDPWYKTFLEECRSGSLSEEMYNYLMGLPTQHTGSWMPDKASGFVRCGNHLCTELPELWLRMAKEGGTWEEMQSLERDQCKLCHTERHRRNRLVGGNDSRLREEPFLSAPYVNRNNEPKYHAMLLRAVEVAKHAPGGPKYILWVCAQDEVHNPKEIGRNPAMIDQKRERFLQFHDQKTAGIPGLLPLFLGLRGRFTEKISKKKSMPILKHQEFIVVGWDLHPIDRQTDQKGERKLHYLPLVIYVKVPGAKWEIHPKLGPGVFPLKPVTREWTINEATEAKASRRGFTAVPDFASTAFMNQGATLDAEIADCGDVMTLPGLTEMVTAYVILSRVRTADTLLLVQAFSHYLFRLGSPPGPMCLMKLLRDRLAGQADENINYTCDQAVEEYKGLLVRWQEEKEIRKHRGQEWQCFDCQLFFPSAGFGADLKNIQDIQSLCIKPGHWRRCLACKNTEVDNPDASTIVCSCCQKQRSMQYFEDGAEFCMSCVLQLQFKVEVCKKCGKHVRRMECADALQMSENYACLSCAPLLRDLECTVCRSTQNILAFPQRQRSADASVRRCQSCSLQCSECQRLMTDCRSFATNSSECWACYRKRDLHTCDACEQVLDMTVFNADVLHNSRTMSRKKVCLQCEEIGYSVRDTNSYQCAGGHWRGHLRFESQLLYNVNRENTSTLVCLDCIKNRKDEVGKCVVCKQQRLREHFDASV